MTLRGVIFRAALYFLIAALPVVIQGTYDVLQGSFKPHPIYYWWVGLTACYQGLVALRAFFDGSAQRHADSQSLPKTR